MKLRLHARDTRAPSHATAGDDEPAGPLAFDRAYDEHFDLVWRVLQRIGVPPAALDDALQDVFLVVHRRLAEFEQRSSLRTWIVGITLRVGLDCVRRHRRRFLVSTAEMDLPDEVEPSPLDMAARSEAVRLLYAVLDELEPDKRAVFVLADVEEMGLREIATALGANLNTIASRLKAARREVQAALDRHRAKDAWRWNRA